MSNIPSFKTNSKPQLSSQEFDATKKDGGKFISDPGTYSMTIKAFSFGEVNPYDSAWINATVTLEDAQGRDLRHFLDIPTECRNSYLFGDKKSTHNLENLQRFLRGLGIVFDYDNGMEQIGAIFGNPDQLIGKPLNVRLGYKGPHIKYVSKDEFLVVEKDDVTPKLEGSFPNKKAAEAAATEAGIKMNKNAGFINVLEIFSAKEAAIDLEAPSTSVDIDLPF